MREEKSQRARERGWREDRETVDQQSWVWVFGLVVRSRSGIEEKICRGGVLQVKPPSGDFALALALSLSITVALSVSAALAVVCSCRARGLLIVLAVAWLCT